MATTVEVKKQLADGVYDAALQKLYGESALAKQRARYIGAVDGFEALFGPNRSIALYSAPGRTEIGGNHTDHNNGVVMAASVDLDILAVVARTNNGMVRVKSKGYDKIDVINTKELAPVAAESGRSASLVRGVAAGIQNLGGKVGGFDAYTTSDVLRGSGLSSSAAFEVCMGAIFRGEYNDNDSKTLSQVTLAKIGQYAENVYFEKPCGLLDQMACAVGGAISIDFLDPSTPVVKKSPFDLTAHGFVLCISDTKGSHADLTDAYAAIRLEMESVAQAMGKQHLREVPEEKFFAAIPTLRNRVGDRAVLRAMHFYAECRRAQDLCTAIDKNEFDRFLQLIIEGGHSSFEYNQNAYSPQDPRVQGIPLALSISQHVLEGRGAWRLQGGGFAGTIQAFVPLDLLEEYRSSIDNVFGEGSCHVLNVRNYGAVKVVPDL